MKYKIFNRRYTGSKLKLSEWICDEISRVAINCDSFCDLFAGTGVITYSLIDKFNIFFINDFLYSNEQIYRAFFSDEIFSEDKLVEIRDHFNTYLDFKLASNYFSDNFGGKFFSQKDARIIGYIREEINQMFDNGIINGREFSILLSSLIYSFDKCANTVGHYDAYIQKEIVKDSFVFELIDPVIKNKHKNRIINITRRDSNDLAKEIYADVVYIDPPYSSRQYSRFYHLIENITEWKKPELFGTALKPKPENMSLYSTIGAKKAFSNLINDLNCRFIFVSYNNTYNSKSSSSKNKMNLHDMVEILKQKGNTIILEKDHKAFNAGKTEFNNHKELLFVTEVGVFND